MKLFKDILKEIKKYNNIVIARHIGADPDALGSQFALKELLQINFKFNFKVISNKLQLTLKYYQLQDSYTYYRYIF